MELCECGEQAVIVSGENNYCENCYGKAKEEAKFARDKHILKDVKGHLMSDGTVSGKATAVIAAGVDPDNYDKIVNEKKLQTEPKANYDMLEEDRDDFKLIWDKDMDKWKENKTWIIDKIIPTKSVGVWTGKRSTFKTFLVLNAVYCVAQGLDFLNLKTEKGSVIYLDKENGLYEMRKRRNLIKKGMEIDKDSKVGFICFSTLKIDKMRDIGLIEEIIKEHKPSLLVVDTYRRGISFEENDAGAVSHLFVDILRPIVEKHDVTIILIHHDRKGSGHGDEMDEIRGSSDLANYADFILKNERKGSKILLKQLKSRNAPEIKPLAISIDTDETNYIKFEVSDVSLQSRDEKCGQLITNWIIKQGSREFTTKEVKEIAFSEGIKKQNFYNGLQLLVNTGIIEKKEHGRYEVISKDLKLELYE